jgi:hypothetical protein
VLLYKLKLCFDLFKAILTDALVIEVYHAVCVVAEHASRLILLQNNAIFVNEDLKRIFFVNVHGLTDADGQYDSAKLVYFTYDTG